MDTQKVPGQQIYLSLTLTLWEDHVKGSQSTNLFPISQGDAHLQQCKNWHPVISFICLFFGACCTVWLPVCFRATEAPVKIYSSYYGEGMQVGRHMSSQTKNNESFTVKVCRGLRWMRCDSPLIPRHQYDTTRRALSAQKLLSNLNKGESVDAAGLTCGACWSCRVVVVVVVVGLWLLTRKSLFVFACWAMLGYIAARPPSPSLVSPNNHSWQTRLNV